MNLQPLYDEIRNLNENIVTLIGAIAATGTSVPAQVAQPAPAETEKSKGGRPKTTYWRLSNGNVVKTSGEGGPAGASEITKAEYEKAQLEAAKATQKPATTEPAGNATSDPFGDDTQASEAITLDDVRTAAFKVRDAKGEAVAKGIIAKYADKLANVKAEQFGALKAELDAALSGGDL